MAASRDDEISKGAAFTVAMEPENKKAEEILPGICRECSDYMCFKHQKKVHIQRTQLSLSGSQLSLIHAAEDGLEKCKLHGEKIKFFCEIHEVVGCGECMILKHQDCKPKYIKDIVKDYNVDSDVKDIAESVEYLDREVNDGKDEIQASKKRNKEMIEKVFEKIKAFRKEMNDYLDKVETEATSDVKQVDSENLAALSILEKEIKEADLGLEDVKRNINSEETRSEVVIFITRVNAKAKLREVLKVADKVRTSNVLHAVKFIKDRELAKICDTRRQLGQVVRVSTESEKREAARLQQLDKSFSELASFSSLSSRKPKMTRRAKTTTVLRGRHHRCYWNS